MGFSKFSPSGNWTFKNCRNRRNFRNFGNCDTNDCSNIDVCVTKVVSNNNNYLRKTFLFAGEIKQLDVRRITGALDNILIKLNLTQNNV